MGNVASETCGPLMEGHELQFLDEEERHERLQGILDRFQISIADANDLTALQDYEIVVIADDSSSMNSGATPLEQRQIGTPLQTRWQELKETLSLIVDLGACFDASGLDIFFLNRPALKGVRSSKDWSFGRAFSWPAKGSTPLTKTLKRVVQECGGERPVLLFILTDGKPNDGVANFSQAIREIVTKESTPHTFRIQVMACTGEEDAVGYLDEIDREFSEVDCTDDYYTEMQQVLKEARRVKKFTRGDWCMKAMLGPINGKFDRMDEKEQSNKVFFGGA